MASSILTSRTVFRRTPNSRTLFHSSEPLPNPLPPTSLLIEVHAISLNYRDSNILNGTNPWPTLANGIPCSDAAGTVVALGSHATRFAIGDRVSPILDQDAITGDEQTRRWLGGEIDGVLASHIVMDEQVCVRIPKHLSWAEAACLPNAGLTAWSSLINAQGELPAGHTVLLQGTGGVSMMALKLALAAGWKVIITSSSDSKLAVVRALGPEGRVQGINYRSEPAWEERVLELTGGRGVDLVVENGGMESLVQSLKAVRKGGTISQVGYLGKQDTAALAGFVSLLIDKTATLRGINVGSRREFEKMNRFIEVTGLRFNDVVGRVYGIDQVQEALETLQAGSISGKIVLALK
ncbi:hypothetical protein B0A48_14586 [Cryoendolithus antarcticus]|uniref:Enoyl reductase (ER) domain-containing protein n=1 Tax=Cryoendolithus antarcticus TaxID=1507870 RepID=A0A1V8SKX6_9PEZI|nr:hypothetical protein B0A48_14586 [Cryoendolithus antarcticus]